MAPKRKAATASSTKDTADAPRSKRKKTEVPEDGPAEASKAAAKATKSTVAKTTKTASTAAKPKPAASKTASASKAKASTASKAKTATKSTPAKAAVKPNTTVKVKAAASKAKAAPKKKAAPRKAAKEEAGLAAEKPKRSRAPTKKQEEADETAADEAKPKTSMAAATPTTAAKPKATAAKAQAASTQIAAASKAKATPKKAAAPKSRTTAAKKPAAAGKATSKRSTKADAENKAEDVTEDEPEESKPKAAAARKPPAAKKARVKKSTGAAEDEAKNMTEEEPERSKPKAAAAKRSAAAKKAPPKRTMKAATADAEIPEEPEDMAEDEPEEAKPKQVRAKRGRTAAAKQPAAEASEEPMDEPEVSKPTAKGARPARATKAAPKEEVGEPDQAAPMEGVEAPAENLEKPAAKGKAAAKPAAKRATKELHYVAPDREESKLEVETSAGKLEKPAAKGKAAAKTATDGQPQSCALSGMPESRKAEEVEEAAEEEPAADKEAAERPPKRRAVAKGKKAAEALQSVEHSSHQKEAGEVYVIGAGDCGQLGVGEDDVEALRARLSSVASGKKVVQVAAGGMHSVALTAEGEVYTCGVNDEGALGRETKGAPWENSPQATGNATDSYQWAKVEMPTEHGKIIQVSAGDSHTMALTEQGFICGWGTFRNSSGVFSFSAHDRLALLPCLVYSPAAAAHQAVKIVSGTDHVVALLRGGNVLSWGTGEQGQLGRVGARLPERGLKELLLAPAEVTLKRAAKAAAADPIVDIAAGNYSTFAVMKSGQVWSWGLNNYGQLAQESEAPVMAPRQAKELNSQTIAAVGPGQHHTLFLTQSGQLLSVGRPTYGRLGQKGVDTASDNPVPVPGDVHAQDTGLESTTVASIVAGPEVSGAIGADGRAWLWGFGTNGQLGNGNDDSDKEVPSLLKGKALQGKRVVQVDFGGQHTLLVVRSDGAGPSSAPAAAATSAGPTPTSNGVAVGMDIDAPSQADGIHENGIMAGASHAAEAADDGIAAAVPRQGDPLLQEASITNAPGAAPAEAAAQPSAAPAQPTGLPATDPQAAAPVTPQVDATTAEAAPLDVPPADDAPADTPDDIPQVDVAAAAAAPAALTHSASGEHSPLQSMAANGAHVPPAAPVPVPAPQEAAPVSVPAAAPMEQPVQALGVNYPLQVGRAGGPGPADATAAAEAAAAAEVAQMVDSMINVPEPEKAMSATQLDPAAVVPAQHLVGLDAVAMQSVQPGPQSGALNACNAQTGLPEASAPLSMPASVPGYVEPAPDQPLESAAEYIAQEAGEPASEAPVQKASDVDDWRESFYALSGSKPI